MGERGNALFRKLDRYAGIPMAYITGKARKMGKRQINPAKPKNVGILCLGAIGDLLLASSLVNGLSQSVKEARIELISSRSNACALELIENAHIKSAFAVKKPWKLVEYVRARSFDLFFDTTQWARLGAIVANLSGAGCTVGFDTVGQWRGGGYDVQVAHSNERHEVENFNALAKVIWSDFAGKPGLLLADNLNNLPHHFVSEPTVYLHMWPAPGRGSEFKKWPEKYWAELADKLLKNGFSVLLTGSCDDAQANLSFLRNFFAGRRNIASIAGMYSLAELAYLLRESKALISVNTGVMHLGALAGAPTIGLHGATNPLRWGPYGNKCISLLPRKGHFAYLNLGFEYPRDAVPSMQWLPVDDVWNALKKLEIKG